MPTTSPNPTERHVRRKRRVLGTLPVAVIAWGAITGLPFRTAAPTAGSMQTKIFTLSGPDAQRTAAASSSGATDRSLRAAPATAAPGWSAELDVADGTQAVAASWTGSARGAVSVRGHLATGYTDWTELQADPADGQDVPGGSTRDAGGMAWFGRDGVDTVQIKVTHGNLADLELQTMRYDEPSGGLITAAAPAGASAAQPEIQPRSSYTSKGWATNNAGCSGGPTTASGGVKFAVVHHTVNANTYAAADVPAMLASIYAYHTGTNGWCDIGYNFIVDRFGRIWEARSGGIDKAIVGGHAQGFNTGSVGVSFLGQFEPGASPTAAAPSSAALDAAGRLIGWKLGMNGIDPTGTVSVTSGGSNKWPAGTVVTINRISGHRDLGQTACPGQNLYDQLGTIRQVAKAAQGGSNTTTTTAAPTTTTTTTTPPPPPALAPFKTASALVTRQYRDVLHRDPTASDLSFWTSRVGTSWTPEQFIAQLTTSAEADNRVHAVTRLYRAYFLRNPDHSGFTYWMNRRGEGRTLTSISQSFAVSSEFTNRYGKLSNAAFVDRIYRNVLGRAADSGGTTYWTKRLNGGMSRGQVMANFSQSSEYIRSTADGVHVVGIYESMLGRAVEPDVYTLFVTGLDNQATSLTSVAAFVFDSDEYAARAG